jgi:NPCBM/NEW2 domain
VIHSGRRTIPSSHRLVIATTLGLALIVGIPSLGSEALETRADSSDPVFKALLLDGRTLAGRIVSVGSGAITLVSAEGAKHELSLEGLLKLTRESSASLAPLDRAHVMLPEGDCLMRVVVGSSTETAVEIQSDALGKLEVPLDSLVALILRPPAQSDELDALWDQVRFEPRSSEVVWLGNGDRLTGGFLGLTEKTIKIQVASKSVAVDRTGALAVGFAATTASYPRPKEGFLELTLRDGTRLGVSEAKLAEGNIEAKSRFGQAIRVPLSELVSIRARSASIAYLAERTPYRVRYFSYVGPSREIRPDRTVDGHPFQLAGQTYDRGIGAQSRTFLVYSIEPGDRRFQALVGVDERAGPLGSVVFRVLVDSQERFKTPPLTDRDPPRSIDLDVSGGKFLILATDFGDRGDVRDLADWVEARLIREKPLPGQ